MPLSIQCVSDDGNIRATGATVVATANPGCLLQLAAGARREGLQIDIVHPVSLLRRAYE